MRRQWQELIWGGRRWWVILVLMLLVAGCGGEILMTGPATITDDAGTTPGIRLTETARPRPSAPASLILATTTSTQDSGLLDILIPLFEAQTGYQVKTIAVGSGAALALAHRGEADVILAHSPEQERQLVATGIGINRQLVMVNDFVIVGPPHDPAGIVGMNDAQAAMRKIATSGGPFISRGDNSGTHHLEMRLWQEAGVTPRQHDWYAEAGTGMGQVLQVADQRRAYTITDRGTYLSFKQQLALDILVEKDERLINVYHVIMVNPEHLAAVNVAGAQAFTDFMRTPETQRLIGAFGRDRYGQPLFTPCADNSCGLEDGDD